MTSTTETAEIQAIQFNGLDDYLRIVGWMKDCGDTYALADEIRYTTPIMLLQTAEGTKAASPGDWIVRGDGGGFSVAKGEPEAEAIHGWFELTYSNYLVLPRSLMQSMPDEWQTRAVKVFEELREAFSHLNHPQYNVETGKWVEPNDLTDDQARALGVTRTDTDDDSDEPSVWHDRFGNELDPDRACVFAPGPDPIPHYNRGRTRVPLAPAA